MKIKVDSILNQFPRKKIVVYGDVGVDQYTVGKVTRISPEAPIPIVEVTHVSHKLGLAANVADNVVALNGKCNLVGVVGNDYTARVFSNLLQKRHVPVKYLVVDQSRPTILKERVVAERQQVVRIDHEKKQKLSGRIISEAEKQVRRALTGADGVIIEDYAKGFVNEFLCRLIVEYARKQKLPVLVDPNGKSPVSLYQGCTVMTPNTAEAESLSGITIDNHKNLRRAGERLMDETDAQYIVITRGRDGMAIFMRDRREPVLIPTFAREVFDVSGAGDTVIATMALAMVSGADIVEASVLANYAAGVEVGKWGTATVSREELKAYIKQVSGKAARVG